MNLERGYVLMLMLFVLIGGSGLWLRSGVEWQSLQMHSVETNLVAMGKARQALISYATVYPYLYGPGGAGPAHLPCPASVNASTDSAISGQFVYGRSEGPNPPCTQVDHLAGKLPRHISLPGHRYLFHSEPAQFFNYSVRRRVVNNPATSPVNSSGITNQDEAARVVAVITHPLRSGSANRFINAYRFDSVMPLNQRALLEAVIPSVAGWYISSVQMPVVDTECQQFAVLHLLFDDLPDGQDCNTVELPSMSIEGIPATRHWFVRNEWYQWIELTIDEHCQQRNLSLCHLVLLKFNTPGSDEQAVSPGMIRLQWQLAS